MKYEIKMDNLLIEHSVIENVEINIMQDIEQSYINDKNRIQVLVEGKIFTKDNGVVKSKNLISDIIKLKDKYFDVFVNIDDMSYLFPKLYIYKLTQKFYEKDATFKLYLLQKFLGDNKEIVVNTNENKDRW